MLNHLPLPLNQGIVVPRGGITSHHFIACTSARLSARPRTRSAPALAWPPLMLQHRRQPARGGCGLGVCMGPRDLGVCGCQRATAASSRSLAHVDARVPWASAHAQSAPASAWPLLMLLWHRRRPPPLPATRDCQPLPVCGPVVPLLAVAAHAQPAPLCALPARASSTRHRLLRPHPARRRLPPCFLS